MENLRGRARSGIYLIAVGALAGCDTPSGPAQLVDSAARVASAAESAGPGHVDALNMRLVGQHDLQARPSYHAVVQAYGDRRILFVGHHAGEAMNSLTGKVETNGMSVLDVTDPRAPQLLSHTPPTGAATYTQHIQVCAGAALPNGNPEKTYVIRTSALLGYELLDVTDPAAPRFLLTIAETGHTSRPESGHGTRETHKIQWDCESGVAYLNGTAQGWAVTRVLQAFDMSNPEQPRHIRDFGLVGWQPGAGEPYPPPEIAGMHQPFAVGNRIFVGYEHTEHGILQILDRDKFLNGIPGSSNPMAPTAENLSYPEIGRLEMSSFWGVHTAKPVYGVSVDRYENDPEFSVRDFVLVVSEASGGGGAGGRCRGPRDIMFMVDVTEEEKPVSVATFQVPKEPGGFCSKNGRFGPHGVHDAFHPGFDKTMAVLSYFNAGIRAVDIRDPFRPIEAGYFIPQVTDKTIDSCTQVDGARLCEKVISTNNVNIDDRGYIYAVDRAHTGLHIVELTGAAREIVGLGAPGG